MCSRRAGGRYVNRAWEGPLTEQEARDLHRRLLLDDPTAPTDLVEVYLDRLTDWLVAQNPRIDPAVCSTAAEDALLAVIKNPASYNPERQRLEVYLRMSAQGDLRNLLRAEQRHSRRRAEWEAVELSPVVGKYIWDEGGDPALIIERREDEPDEPSVAPLPDSVRAGLTPQEQRVLELMERRERKTAVFAEVLGLTHLPPDEQRQMVKRVKDRLIKRRERAGGRHD